MWNENGKAGRAEKIYERIMKLNWIYEEKTKAMKVIFRRRYVYKASHFNTSAINSSWEGFKHLHCFRWQLIAFMLRGNEFVLLFHWRNSFPSWMHFCIPFHQARKKTIYNPFVRWAYRDKVFGTSSIWNVTRNESKNVHCNVSDAKVASKLFRCYDEKQKVLSCFNITWKCKFMSQNE